MSGLRWSDWSSKQSVDHVVAVSDACAGSVDEQDINIVDGELYGSKLHVPSCTQLQIQCPPWYGGRIQGMLRNPARAVRKDHLVGTIQPGRKANFVFVDEEYNVSKVIWKETWQADRVIPKIRAEEGNRYENSFSHVISLPRAELAGYPHSRGTIPEFDPLMASCMISRQRISTCILSVWIFCFFP